MPKLIGSRFSVQARPGLRLVAYASENATALNMLGWCQTDATVGLKALGSVPGLGERFKGHIYFKPITTISGEFPVLIGGPQVPTPLVVYIEKLPRR